MSKATALVTGGAGFIGSHVAKHLVDKSYRVLVLDDLSGGFESNVPSGSTFIRGSILDEALLCDIFRDHTIDHVFHLAAYAAEGLSPFIRRFNYQNNLIGSINLINLSIKHKVRRFVFTSSIAVYGSNQLPMHEDLTPEPEDPYGISKYAVELDLKEANRRFSLDYVIFRPHNVYGEHQNVGDRYRNVIGIFMNQIMEGKPLTIFGDGEQTRAFSYIDDVAMPIVNSIENDAAKNNVFNVGADVPYSVNTLARSVMKAMGKEVPLVHIESRNEVLHAYADHTKVKRAFSGLEQATPLDEGLARMAKWAKNHGARKTERFANIEIEEGLPSIWLEGRSDGGSS